MATSGRITQALRKSQAMGPSVRNLISQYKLDPAQIASTGPHQILLKGDVLNYLNSRSATPAAAAAAQGQQQPGAATTAALSAQKPQVGRSSSFANQFTFSTSSSRYTRRTLTQLEMDVINSGGVVEPPPPPPGKNPKKR